MDDKVLVQVVKQQEKATSSGFILTSLEEEKPHEAIVIAVGPGLKLNNGDVIIPDVKIGDKVVFAKYQGTEVKFDNQEYLILAYRDIFAVIEEIND